MKRIKIEFTHNKLTLDQWISHYTRFGIFMALLTVFSGVWIYLHTSTPYDKPVMIILGLSTVAYGIMRTRLVIQRDREREEKKDGREEER